VSPGEGKLWAAVKDGIIEVSVPDGVPVYTSREAVKQGYEFILQKTLEEIASLVVPVWSARLGIQIPRVRYGNQKTKWGACSPRGIILNIRLAMAPRDLIEYVIVHELCHVRHQNHSKKFWSLVETMIPDYRDRKKRLNDEGLLYSL
jgi:predicted metal-dependent hydrolase